jgi:flagellar hook-associated protein 3 FlgL
VRVTTFGVNTRFLAELDNIMSKYQDLENELSTGRKLNQPSDDPVGFEVDIQTQVSIEQVKQWASNVDSALSELQTADATISSLNQVLGSIRTNLVQAVNGSTTQSDVNNLVSIVSQLVQEVGQIANTTDGQQYLFAGKNGKVQPVKILANGQLQWNATGGTPDKLATIGDGVTIAVGVNGSDVFQSTFASANPARGNTTLLDTLNNIVADLQAAAAAPDTATFQTNIQTVQYDLQDLDTAIDHTLALQADLGGRLTRVRGAQSLLAQSQNLLAAYKSKVEDADLAQVLTQLATQQTVYQAALISGQRMILPTLAEVMKS